MPILVLSFGLVCIVTPESCTVQLITSTDGLIVGALVGAAVDTAAVGAVVDTAVGGGVAIGRSVDRSSVGDTRVAKSDAARFGVETIGVSSLTGSRVTTTA